MITIKTGAEIEKMHVSGQMLHKVLTALRAEIREGITTNQLDKMAEDMIRSMGATPSFKGYHGFPRSVVQADALSSFTQIDCVVDIDVADEKLLARLTGRRVCKECQGTFHISTLETEACPVCGGELYQRDDDKLETIQNRLSVYHAQTAPLIEYYQTRGMLKEIDGDNAPDTVTQAILAALECE